MEARIGQYGLYPPTYVQLEDSPRIVPHIVCVMALDEVGRMLSENKARVDKIFGKHDQFTGKGMELHEHKYQVKDYPIPTQWLTDEVYNNELYKAVKKSGSIAKFVEDFYKEYGEELSVDEVIHEMFMARIARDPSFAFYTCFQIKDKVSGQMIPFTLNYAQRTLLVELEKMRLGGVPIRIVLLKARQWGGSTFVQLYMAWIQLHLKVGWYSVILAQTKDTARRIKAMYKKVLEGYPAFVFDVSELKFSPYEGSASDSIITDKSGKVVRDNVITVASYENFESARGMDYAMAHYSEVAYWRTTPMKSAEAVVTNISGGILNIPLTMEVMESTACGQSGYFYDVYQSAKKEISNRKAVFIPFFYIENDMKKFRTKDEKREFAKWLLTNRHDDVAPNETSESGKYLYSLWVKGATLEHINWYIEKRKGFHDHGSMASEAPSDDIECFVYSSKTIFSPYHIKMMEEKYKRDPIAKGNIAMKADGSVHFTQGNLTPFWVWKHPDKIETHDRYLVTVDVGGRTDRADYSCITVVDRWPLLFGGSLEVVARWHGHVRYDELARKAVAVAKYYHNALLAFESNTFDKKRGEANEYIQEGDHIRGILNTVEYDNLYMRRSTDPEDIKNGTVRKIGFNTNRKTKQDMIDNFIVVFEDDKFIDPDERFYQEAFIYVQRDDGTYGNKEGKDNHDDIFMTDMIAALISNSMPMPSVARGYAEEVYHGTRNESYY